MNHSSKAFWPFLLSKKQTQGERVRVNSNFVLSSELRVHSQSGRGNNSTKSSVLIKIANLIIIFDGGNVVLFLVQKTKGIVS